MSKGITAKVSGSYQKATGAFVNVEGDWIKFGGGKDPAVFDEAKSNNCTFTTLTNPFGDGKDYRMVEFKISGTLVLESPGFADYMIVGGGGNGGRGSNNNGTHSSGGGGGGAGNMVDSTMSGGQPIFLGEGSHAITVASAASASKAFGITMLGGKNGGNRCGGWSATLEPNGCGTNQYHPGGGGGGGFSAPGRSANGSAPGGAGIQSNFTGTLEWFCAGGSGGGSWAYGPSGSVNGISGAGGGGNATNGSGAGGGGANQAGASGAGATGLVRVRVPIN